MDLLVEKRDGTVQAFDRQKLYKSMVNAGASSDVVENLIDRIVQWAQENAENKKVSSSDIRSKVIELLGNFDQKAAQAYLNYREVVK